MAKDKNDKRKDYINSFMPLNNQDHNFMWFDEREKEARKQINKSKKKKKKENKMNILFNMTMDWLSYYKKTEKSIFEECNYFWKCYDNAIND